MSETALVTGSAGFIGFHTAERFLQAGKRVIGLDAMTDYYEPELKEARHAILSQSPGFTAVNARPEDEGVMADLLAEGINAADGSRVTNTIGANMLFPEITLAQHKRLQAAGAVYYTISRFDPDGPDDQIINIRLVASFRTTEDDVSRFTEALAG